MDGGGRQTTGPTTATRPKPWVVVLNGATFATVSVNGNPEDLVKNIENIAGGSGAMR